jgi:hypothetical protein
MKILSLKHARAAAVAVFLAAYGLVPDTAGLAQALSFGKAKSYTVGTNPVSVVAGDFNNDSNVDLAVVNNIINKVSILLGDGAGGFPLPLGSSTYPAFPVGMSPLGAAAGNFNSNIDSNLDLAVANFVDNTVSILLGNGDGTFSAATPVSLPPGSGPISIAVGDFNGGGFLDLAIVNHTSGNVSIFLGNGDGTFTEATGSPFTVGKQPVSIAVGQFNSDVDLFPDLAVANFVDNSVSILLGNGDGTFIAPPHCDTTTPGTSPTCIVVGTEPVSIVTGDFNNDEVDDLAIANEVTKNVSILLGNAITTTGLFQAARSFNLIKIPVSLTVADFNGDGALDLAAAHSPDKLLSVILGNGDGTFGTPKTFKTVAGEFAITNGDFDGDSKPDLAVVNGKISVLLNNTLFPGASPSITVTAPNGGAPLAIGASTNITWTSNDIPPASHVRIDLTRDSTLTPIVWKTIFKSVTVAAETTAWKVTGSATTHAQIRICAIEYPGICDISDADFTIN